MLVIPDILLMRWLCASLQVWVIIWAMQWIFMPGQAMGMAWVRLSSREGRLTLAQWTQPGPINLRTHNFLKSKRKLYVDPPFLLL